MKFEINFNREDDDKTLIEIGAQLEHHSDSRYSFYWVKLNSFEELEELLYKVEAIKGEYYSAVISYDSPTIYLDKDV